MRIPVTGCLLQRPLCKTLQKAPDEQPEARALQRALRILPPGDLDSLKIPGWIACLPLDDVSWGHSINASKLCGWVSL